MTDSKTITVYVRLGSGETNQERELTFKLCDDIPVSDLLANNIAIDGNVASLGVGPIWEDMPHTSALYGYAMEGGSHHTTLSGALVGLRNGSWNSAASMAMK